MAESHNFEHLPLLLRYEGAARLRGFGQTSPQTVANRNARQAHSISLHNASQSFSANWQNRRSQRQGQSLPVIAGGVPILIEVDPSLDLDVLREKFSFEIVAEQEEGYVIVASEDIELNAFKEMVNGFATQVHGAATVASVHRLFDDPSQTERLRRILSETLFGEWNRIDDGQLYVVDLGIACVGTSEIPPLPRKGKRDTDASWAKKERDWSQARADAYSAWDDIKRAREAELEEFIHFYQAEILHLIDGSALDAVLPDSFTVRLRINGAGLKDLILNYAYIFEVLEPEDIALPQQAARAAAQLAAVVTPMEPDVAAPAVCVIDSGIQESHTFLEPAIDAPASYCFLPGTNTADVGDYVRPAGHGTRVAGAVLYGETIVDEGSVQLPFWIQNARVLDEQNTMPVELLPAAVIRAVVDRFHGGSRRTRIFNHSINAYVSCRTRHMSAWAAEIDMLCNSYDILVIQSAGNLQISGNNPYPGVKDHLNAGREYPDYFCEASARIANPSQSLQAITVGSIAYGAFEAGDWRTFAQGLGRPSAFSRSGPGIWNTIKPEVVEYGGDDVRTHNVPADVQDGGRVAAACPELIRSTMYPPGPAFDRDETGTSFAAPKVTRLAARLQQLFPDQSALLYRALIIQSARWPSWADDLLKQLRNPELQDQVRKQQLLDEASRVIRSIGYGHPDENRATANIDYRTTFITNDEKTIRARECHIYQVPIPMELRRPGDEFDLRIDVTMSYCAQPRRTRRNLRRYLSTWVDWKSSRLGESIDDFRVRALKEEESGTEPLPASGIPWTLNESAISGFVRDTKRNNGTVQKDWATVKSNMLPENFCIAVVGHQGWSHDPDSEARYALTVTFEILGQEIVIYEPLRAAVIELQTELEAETGVEVEVEVEE